MSSQNQINSTGYVTKRKSFVDTTKMLFSIFSQNPIINFFRDGGSNLSALKDVDGSDSEKDVDESNSENDEVPNNSGFGPKLKLESDPVIGLQTPADILSPAKSKSETLALHLNLRKTGSATDTRAQPGHLNS